MKNMERLCLYNPLDGYHLGCGLPVAKVGGHW